MEKQFYDELEAELSKDILPFWEKFAKDEKSEGFFGSIDNENKGNAEECRTIVMVSRFLWTYSAAARLYHKLDYLEMADYAYKYMGKYFFDTLNGGMYWSVKADGDVLDERKNIMGISYAIYAISEFAAALKEVRNLDYPSTVVLDKAMAMYTMLQFRALDKENGGYWNAVNKDWTRTEKTAIGADDVECAKSMNTNLHVLEAFTNLYRCHAVVYPQQQDTRGLIGKSIAELVNLFTTKIFDEEKHLKFYFDEKWNETVKAENSLGHNIEASWLLFEAVNETDNQELLEKTRQFAVDAARVALVEGFDRTTGGFEKSINGKEHDTTRIWWNQAEALIGFFNAWELTGGEDFKSAFLKGWEWIKAYQIDKKNGDWFAAVTKEGTPVLTEPKGGNWKTSYHNARCCMELLKRVNYFER